MYKKYVKRTLDIFISIISLPILGIISILVIPLIKKEDRGPVIYVSDRLGRGVKGFKMYKFRTMKVNAPDIRTKNNETFNSENDNRLTKIGKILRKLSIDETPQIINVLKGDMSIIGPRPNLNDYGEHVLSKIELKRLEVRPGITGYNQAYFRNSISMEEKFRNDVYYIEHLTFLMDIKILIQTVRTVFKKDNVYNEESVEVENGSLFNNRSN